MTGLETKLPILWALSFGLTSSYGQTGSYECTVFPEDAGWERINFTEITRRIDDGVFEQSVHDQGISDYYRLSLAEFAGETSFFVEWRVQTGAPSSLLDTSRTPVVVSAAGSSAAFYHFTMTDSQVQIWRGNSVPLLSVEIAPSVPHTYRVEVCNVPMCTENRYAWYIDGQMGDSGVAPDRYPKESSFLIWGIRGDIVEFTTPWDYVRYGVIPQDASGDFDSNEGVELFDFYFVHECLTNDRIGIHGGPGNEAGPGCRFTDFDGDSDVDLCDFAEFQNRFGDPN